MAFEVLEDPTGKPVTAKATADGVQLVEATISGSIEGAATEVTLAAVENAVDGLEVSAATTATKAGEIDDNTDQVEQLLTDIKKIGQVADSIPFTEHTVTNASVALPVLSTPHGFEIQVPDGAGGPVYVREIATVTTSGVGRGWEIAVGSSKFFPAPTTTGWKAISTAASVEVLIAHEVKA